jgi:hypothetical protein
VITAVPTRSGQGIGIIPKGSPRSAWTPAEAAMPVPSSCGINCGSRWFAFAFRSPLKDNSGLIGRRYSSVDRALAIDEQPRLLPRNRGTSNSRGRASLGPSAREADQGAVPDRAAEDSDPQVPREGSRVAAVGGLAVRAMDLWRLWLQNGSSRSCVCRTAARY